MRHHEIILGELLIWKEESDITYASSTRERKKLVCNLYGSYKVLIAEKMVWEGVSASVAVLVYNNITEPYKTPTIHL